MQSSIHQFFLTHPPKVRINLLSMKNILLCSSFFLYSLTGVGLAERLGPREFFNADRSQSFKATLLDYDASEQLVFARPIGGSTMKFKLDVLCSQDQAYVKEQAASILLGRKIDVTFQEWTGDTKTDKNGAVRSSKVDHAYDVTFEQTEDINLSTGLTMKYILFVKRGQEEGASKTEQISGSKDLSGLLDSSSYTVRTDTVEIERYRRKAAGGGG